MTDVLINTGRVAFNPKRGTLYTLGKDTPSDGGAKPSTPDLITPYAGTEITPWFEGTNSWPQDALKEIEKNAVLARALSNDANSIVSGGVIYGIPTETATGDFVLKQVRDPKVEAFFKRSNISRLLYESTHEFKRFWNIFPEIILTKDRSEIYQISLPETCYCRVSAQNKANNNKNEFCYIKSDWDTSTDLKTAIKVPLLDPYFETINELRYGKAFKYILPIRGQSSNKSFYSLPVWWTAKTSGWLDFANSIPALKKAMMKNQIFVGYHIQVDESWFPLRYKNWENMNEKEQEDKIVEQYGKINDLLQGEENYGRSILTQYAYDRVTGKEYANWKIETIGDKYESGIYVEDSQEAVSHILQAVGVDSAVAGIIPGKTMGGTGSEKRVGFNIWSSLNKPEHDIMLEMLTLARDYNGWNPDYQFMFNNYWITTLDKGKEAQQQSS